MGWRLTADAVVLVHVAFVAFVVVGGLLVLRWRWVSRIHVPVVVYGVMISLIGFTCPLTPLEKWLRRRAGSVGYEGGFVEHYVVPVLYPGELTPRIEVGLAVSIVVVNVVGYAVVGRIGARSRPAGGRQSDQLVANCVSSGSAEKPTKRISTSGPTYRASGPDSSAQ